MANIFGAKLNALNIIGCVVLISFLFLGVNSLIGAGIRDKTAGVTIEQIQQINEPRYRYEDSLSAANNRMLIDSITALNASQYKTDSLLFIFYNRKINEYESNINAINSATDDDLLRAWAKKYGR